MITESLIHIFKRDLNKLIVEIENYQYKNNIWIIDKGIANSAGNLCLHLIGNLNTYIGAELGHTGYIRDRPLEFSQKNVERSELIKKIKETIDVVEQVLSSLTKDVLDKEFPVMIFEKNMSTQHVLIHLACHLSYHLGQINYHRRLLDH